MLQITGVKIPFDQRTRQPKSIAFVEFGDEEAMHLGLDKHGSVRHTSASYISRAVAYPYSARCRRLRIRPPRVTIAEDRPDHHDRPAFRGGRGGGRGGFNRHGVHAAAVAAAGPGGSKFGRGANGDRDGGEGKRADGPKKSEQA